MRLWILPAAFLLACGGRAAGDSTDVTPDGDAGLLDVSRPDPRTRDSGPKPDVDAGEPPARGCPGDDGEPLALVTDEETSIASIAVDGDSVYWSVLGGQVKSVKRCGGAPTILVDHLGGGLTRIALDASNVYWTARSEVHRIAKTGGPTEIFATAIDEGTFANLAIDGPYLYAESTKSLSTFSLADGAATVLGRLPPSAALSGVGTDTPLLFDSGNVYLTWWSVEETRKSNDILYFTKGGFGPGTVYSQTSLYISAIAIDGHDLYFADRGGAKTGLTRISTWEDPAALTPVPGAEFDSETQALVVDDTYLYRVGVTDKVATLQRGPKGGGAFEDIATSSHPLWNDFALLAMDDVYVYAVLKERAIVRVKR
jgi:hypothetical protein